MTTTKFQLQLCGASFPLARFAAFIIFNEDGLLASYMLNSDIFSFDVWIPSSMRLACFAFEGDAECWVPIPGALYRLRFHAASLFSGKSLPALAGYYYDRTWVRVSYQAIRVWTKDKSSRVLWRVQKRNRSAIWLRALNTG